MLSRDARYAQTFIPPYSAHTRTPYSLVVISLPCQSTLRPLRLRRTAVGAPVSGMSVATDDDDGPPNSRVVPSSQEPSSAGSSPGSWTYEKVGDGDGVNDWTSLACACMSLINFFSVVSCRLGSILIGDGEAGDLRCVRGVLAEGSVPGVFLVPQGRDKVRAAGC